MNLLLMGVLTQPASAGKVFHPPAIEFIQAADVVLTVTITEKKDNSGDCSGGYLFKLKPGTVHSGRYRNAPLRYYTWWPSLYDKQGHKAGCKSSVSYTESPKAKNLEVGQKVLATAVYVRESKEYDVTATFELDQLKALSAHFKKR